MDQECSRTGRVLLYDSGESKEFVSVVFQDETFWLTQSGMAELFDCTPENIIQHLKNIYTEEELDLAATAKKFLVVRQEGARQVCRSLDHYNLDAIIAVGYRVNSKRVTRFRQWATKTLKEYIQKGFVLNDEMMKNGRPFGNEKEISCLNRLVTMFIDYAELMAEDEQLMSMKDWLAETDRFLTNNRRNVLEGKGKISRDDAVKKVSGIYAEFRKKQDANYISEFDRQTAKYLKGGE